MHQIELILFCLAIGVLLRWSGRLPDAAPKVLGGWVINVALPAAALRSVHDVTFDADWWLAAATPWIGVAFAIIILVPIGRSLNWSRQRLGALLLVAGWGNTSFVGIPMITALAGAQWLGLGLVIDLFGSYLALSVVGITIATICSDATFDIRVVMRRIITFPPFIAIIVAITTNHLDRPVFIDDVVNALAMTLTPLALAAVGFALRLDRISGRLAALGLGLGFRLVVAPFLILVMYLLLGKIGDPAARIAILEMAMPPMLGASIIAMGHDLEPDLVVLMIGLGVPLSMLTAPLWWSLIAAF
tara:strand:- start:12166 stop:13071 length:906 start_codon:yes stop_codon:yes gene_type:complete